MYTARNIDFLWRCTLIYPAVVNLLVLMTAYGDNCFNCMYNQNPDGVGYACVTSPDEVSSAKSMPCPGQCSTFVQTIKESQKIFHITRGCAQKKAGCYEDTAYRYCVELCDGVDCNSRNEHQGKSIPKKKQNKTRKRFPKKEGMKKTPTEKVETYPCYACQFHEGADDTCMTSPDQLTYNNKVQCPKGHKCSIFRQFDLARKLIRSFSRGCVPASSSHARNICETDVHFETCSSSCDQKLCNTGDGLSRQKSAMKYSQNSADRHFDLRYFTAIAFVIMTIKRYI